MNIKSPAYHSGLEITLLAQSSRINTLLWFNAWYTTPCCSQNPYICIIPFEYQSFGNGWHSITLSDYHKDRVPVAEYTQNETSNQLCTFHDWWCEHSSKLSYSFIQVLVNETHSFVSHISHLVRNFCCQLRRIKTTRMPLEWPCNAPSQRQATLALNSWAHHLQMMPAHLLSIEQRPDCISSLVSRTISTDCCSRFHLSIQAQLFIPRPAKRAKFGERLASLHGL